MSKIEELYREDDQHQRKTNTMIEKNNIDINDVITLNAFTLGNAEDDVDCTIEIYNIIK